MKRSLLVYDGRHPAFRAAAEAAVGRADDIAAVRWESDPVQAFLEAQFDGRPFAFIFVEGDDVHVGTETVGRVLRRLGVADPLVEGLQRAYAVAADPFGRLVHGRTVADLDGTFPLSAEAAAHLEPARRVREIPVREADAE